MNKKVQDKLLTAVYLYNLLRAFERRWQSTPTDIYLPKPWTTLHSQ